MDRAVARLNGETCLALVCCLQCGTVSGDAKTNFARAGLRYYALAIPTKSVIKYAFLSTRCLERDCPTGFRTLYGRNFADERKGNRSSRSISLPAWTHTGAILDGLWREPTVTFQFYKRGQLLFPVRAFAASDRASIDGESVRSELSSFARRRRGSCLRGRQIAQG
jgi:hypothetical protein